MKFQTTKLKGAALNWAVAIIEYGNKVHIHKDIAKPAVYLGNDDCVTYFTPSTTWEQGGIILDREIKTLERDSYEGWFALSNQGYTATGPTSLIATMRCYVLTKLGEEVDIPDELITLEEASI